MNIQESFDAILSMVFKKYNNMLSDFPVDMIAVSLTSILNYYGDWILPILHDVFFESKFLIAELPLKEIIRNEQEKESSSFFEETFLDCPAFSTSNCFYYFEKDGTCVLEKEMPKIFCSTIGKNPNELLNIYTHEFNHLLKSKLKNHGKFNDSSYWLRSGLHFFISYFQDGYVYEVQQYEILDEVINVFQTSDIMKEVKQLENVSDFSFLWQYLKSLDYDSLDDPYGYTLEATILDDFWKKTQFKEQIKKPLIFGNISTIENGFNHIVKSDLFSSFADCFDEIENSLMTEENFKNTIKIIKDISKFYQLNESFSYKKKI